MSVQAIAWVLEHSRSKGTARCVLISIANHVGPDGSGWVHVRRVISEANCSRDSYYRAVADAEAAGEVVRVHRGGGGPRLHDAHRPNLFVFPSLSEVDVPERPDPVPRVDDRSDDVSVVFDAWVAATGRNPTRTKLTAQRRSRVRARLSEGYSVGDLVAAVQGVARSPFHMGDNDRRQRFDDLTLVLRDGGQVEKFGGLVEAPNVSHPAVRRVVGCELCVSGWVEQADGSVIRCRTCSR